MKTQNQTLFLKPGHGYWNTTHYPLGGCFRRVGNEPLKIEVTGTIDRIAAKGCDTTGKLENGDTVAFDSRYCDTQLEPRNLSAAALRN